MDDLDPEVAAALDAAFGALSAAGARIEPFDFPELERIAAINARGTLSSAEVFALHRRLGLLAHKDRYDPNVAARIDAGAGMSAADYVDLVAARAALIADADRRTARFDAVIFPTTPILAPRIADVATPEAFSRQNLLALRNTAVANLLDRCAISLPMATQADAPGGTDAHGRNPGRCAAACACGVDRDNCRLSKGAAAPGVEAGSSRQRLPIRM